jgi:CheY-like chemotaxis protein
MTESWATIIAAIIAIVPLTLAFVLLGALALTHRKAVAAMLERASKIGVAGVFELELDTQAIKEAREDAPLTDEQATALDRRIAKSKTLVAGSRILWVDDAPSNNRLERKYLRSAGATVVNATTTMQALVELERFDYDLVFTDLRRPRDPQAGLELVSAMRAAHYRQPVIAYVGYVDSSRGTPSELFGMADRPDELVNLYLDALERS